MLFLKVDNVTVREHGDIVIKNLSFSMGYSEHWAITGPSGCGKTSLLHALSKRNFINGSVVLHDSATNISNRIVLVEQQHHFKNLSNTGTFYYQQRYNASDSEDAVTVEEYLRRHIKDQHDNEAFPAPVEHLLQLFQLRVLLPVKLIQLSNGENKRLQIAKALLLEPAILMLDSPFTGLDVDARIVLEALLDEVIRKGVQIILVTSPHQMPGFVTHVLSLQKDGGYSVESAETYLSKLLPVQSPSISFGESALFKLLLSQPGNHDFEFAVRMKHVNVEYNRRRILDDISWDVRRGDCWSLSGPNGSGKSTLLSLINADNPQAYANDIIMFDRKRGIGETIWEIKKNIGFVSPELHLYFDSGISCFHVVASGFFDTIGLFRMLTERQSELVLQWMKLLNIGHLSNHLFASVSNGEQRLALLARALVKNPPMLVLDEPCQGLDEAQVLLFRSMVNDICSLTNKTLIYVSHYTQEIPLCVDKFIRLQNGRVVMP